MRGYTYLDEGIRQVEGVRDRAKLGNSYFHKIRNVAVNGLVIIELTIYHGTGNEVYIICNDKLEN